MSSKIFLIILFLLAVITRFSGINWGNGIFFHPDENNMATALSQLSWNNFNPNFYAYGQFPLYLGFFSLKIIGLTNNFPNSVFILRFWSAIFSLSSLYFFYKIFSNKFFLILLIFSPGLIQLSHFGTTESLLVMVFAICLYLSIYKPKSYFVYSLILAIGVASKISALIFFVPFIIINFKKPLLIVFSLIITLILSTLLSPYNLINFADFKSSMVYETSVAAGKLPVFYTHQFLGSIPYFFQFTRIFPYTSGITVYIFAFISIFLINKSLLKNKRFLIIGISSLVYFLYFGQLYVKWTRFMSPLFFIFPLLSSQLINRQKKYFQIPLILLGIIPGMIYFSNYFIPDVRWRASYWINQHIQPNVNILSESGNVVNLPLSSSNFQINNFNFYDFQPSELVSAVHWADYILIPSRRVFKNYQLKYYQSLFNGNLGFSQLKTFTPISDLWLNQENAEETWSVFDRPTVRLYQKNILFTPQEYGQKI